MNIDTSIYLGGNYDRYVKIKIINKKVVSYYHNSSFVFHLSFVFLSLFGMPAAIFLSHPQPNQDFYCIHAVSLNHYVKEIKSMTFNEVKMRISERFVSLLLQALRIPTLLCIFSNSN